MLDNQPLHRFARLALVLAASVLSLGSGVPDDREREVVTRTEDADGAPRVRTIWFAWIEDALYIRTTRRATWGANVLREGRVALELEGTLRHYRATPIEDRRELERVHARFREKYGAGDWWADRVRVFFGGKVAFELTPMPPARDGPSR